MPLEQLIEHIGQYILVLVFAISRSIQFENFKVYHGCGICCVILLCLVQLVSGIEYVRLSDFLAGGLLVLLIIDLKFILNFRIHLHKYLVCEHSPILLSWNGLKYHYKYIIVSNDHVI